MGIQSVQRGVYFSLTQVNAYHFETHNYEFQVAEYAFEDKKNALLKNLIPTYNKCEKEQGDIPYVSIFVTHHRA